MSSQITTGRNPFTTVRNGAGLRVAYVASYPPRECGIATFTHDVLTSVAPLTPVDPLVVAMNDIPEGYEYPPEVRLTIDPNDRAQYTRVADALTASGIEVVNIQHEYGLFGGDWGEYLLDLIERVQVPVVTTLHTAIPNPGLKLREVTRSLVALSDRAVVLAEAAIPILMGDYGIPRDKIQYIPHGIPVVERRAGLRREAQDRLGFEGKRLMATFGLISPNKGIEHVIHALPEIVAEHPDVLYLVLGETHPGVRRHSGESYRDQLRRLAYDLGVEDYVRFEGRFLTLPQLIEYLLATDVYLMPYLDPNQIVSGTLSYALGAGKAVIATPFTFACETLTNGRGIIVNFADPAGISSAANGLLGDREKLLAMERRAYEHTRAWVWPAVGREYYRLFEQLRAAVRPGAQLKAA